MRWKFVIFTFQFRYFRFIVLKNFPLTWFDGLCFSKCLHVCLFHVFWFVKDTYIIKNNMLQRPFHERWMILENEVIKPRNHERDMLYRSRNPYYRYDLEPFRVWALITFELSFLAKILFHLLSGDFMLYIAYVHTHAHCRWEGRIFICSLLSLSFCKSSFQSFHMKLMV